MRRTATAAVLLALAATLSGCGLGCEDVNRIHAATASGFGVTATDAAGTTAAMLYGSADYTQQETGSIPDFDEVFAVLARNSGDGRSLQFTLVGFETVPGDRLVLVLSVPTRAQQGDRFRVAGAFAPPAPWVDEWTFRRAAAPGDVEIAFARTRATIPNPPYNYAAVYTATRATGTVQVLRRERGHLDLQLDLTATDEAGRGYRIAGSLGVTAAKEGEACFSLS